MTQNDLSTFCKSLMMSLSTNARSTPKKIGELCIFLACVSGNSNIKVICPKEALLSEETYTFPIKKPIDWKQNLTNIMCFHVISVFFIIVSILQCIYVYPVFTSMKACSINCFKCIFLAYCSRYSQRHIIWNHLRP